jgi:hypothetical protein
MSSKFGRRISRLSHGPLWELPVKNSNFAEKLETWDIVTKQYKKDLMKISLKTWGIKLMELYKIS